MFNIWSERDIPPQHLPLLRGVARVIGSVTATPDTPLVAFPQAHGIVAAARVRYEGTLLDQAPGLRVIARTGIGYDNINLDDATQRGIAVCNVPDGPTVSTAEHTIALLLAVAKQLKRCDRLLCAGITDDVFSSFRGVELDGLCLGVIGLGRIGSRVAQIGSAFGMDILAFDPWVSGEHVASLGVTLAPTLESVLRQADVVTLHVPLSPDTYHLMNASRFAQMKAGAIFVNAGRGGLVDEAALLEALDSGHLLGAGLDVFGVEPPPPDHPLLQREDVVATPHIAGATAASQQRLWQGAISQVLQVLQGVRPRHLLNPEVWSRIEKA